MRVADARDPQTCAIIGAAMELHCQLSGGPLETVYQDTAVIEFPLGQIQFEKEVNLPIRYKNNLLPTYYRADFVCFSEVIVEFKALSQLSSVEQAQLLGLLKATGLKRGLLINFGVPSIQYKRLAWGYEDLTVKSAQAASSADKQR